MELRPEVQRFAEIIEQHLQDTADKGPWRSAFLPYQWFAVRVLPGIGDLGVALDADFNRGSLVTRQELEKRLINHATRAFILADLCWLMDE